MAITGPYRTSTDLVNDTLAELGVLAPGQIVDPEDFNYVSVELDSVFRKLAALEIVYIADPQNIRSDYFRELVAVLAGECCTKFGSNPDDWTRLKTASDVAVKNLRAMNRGKPTGEALRIEYF